MRLFTHSLIYSFTHFYLFIVINCNATTKLTKILIIYIKSNELWINGVVLVDGEW